LNVPDGAILCSAPCAQPAAQRQGDPLRTGRGGHTPTERHAGKTAGTGAATAHRHPTTTATHWARQWP